MTRAGKPIALVKGHRTKAEIERRKKAESLMATGLKMREYPSVKADKKAHAYYLRVRKIFEEIGKNDALNESVLNRYCKLLSESDRYEEKDKYLQGLLEELHAKKSELEFLDYTNMVSDINKLIQGNDKSLQTKRRMLLAIEKENVMTIASQLRSIPKKEEDDEDDSGMAAFLKNRRVADENKR